MRGRKQEERDKIKRRLRGYRHTKSELMGKIHMLKCIRQDLYGAIVPPPPDGMPKGKRKGDATGRTVMRLERLGGRIDELTEKLAAEMAAIEDMLGLLEADERAVLVWRYINGIYWENMSDYVHYEQRQCRRIHDRAIDKLCQAMKKGG